MRAAAAGKAAAKPASRGHNGEATVKAYEAAHAVRAKSTLTKEEEEAAGLFTWRLRANRTRGAHRFPVCVQRTPDSAPLTSLHGGV